MSKQFDIAAPGSEAKEFLHLRKQRDSFAFLAVLSFASIGFAMPRKLSNYRELARVNKHIVELQQGIDVNQLCTREVEANIIRAQQEIKNRLNQ